MVKMDSFSFGTIVVGCKKYHHDVVILPDGSVYRRKSLIPSLFAHSIEMRELKKLVKAGSEVALIKKGAFNKAHLSAEAEDYAKGNKSKTISPSFSRGSGKAKSTGGTGKESRCYPTYNLLRFK